MRTLLLITSMSLAALGGILRPVHAAADPVLALVEENVALRTQVEQLTQSVAALRAELSSLRADTTPPESSPTLLRERIAEYRQRGGVPWFVNGGHTTLQHLIDEHGWSAAQLRGLTQNELDELHGASHTGQIKAADFGPRSVTKSNQRRAAKATTPRIQPRGRWVRQCIDGECRTVWQPDD